MHKLAGPVTNESWKVLSSRPIRGAESDPIKAPSRVLYGLLQQMLSDLKTKFPSLHPDQLTGFTVLSGCDDYLRRLQRVQLDPSDRLKTTLISCDFGDAFTETGIDRLQQSISVIGKVVSMQSTTVDLMVQLVSLVFSNCYIYTPTGLYRQTRGMPMGDYSSR